MAPPLISNLFSQVIQAIRRKSREEWRQHLIDKLTDLRIWAQEHGEKAAVVSLVVGMFLVLAFKIFVFVAVVAILFGYAIWFTARPQSEQSNATARLEPHMNDHSNKL